MKSKIFSFFSISGDVGAGYRKLKGKVQFNGSGGDSVKAKDVFFFVRVLGITSYTNTCVSIFWQFWAIYSEGFGIILNGCNI
jgi:hypothetical protein